MLRVPPREAYLAPYSQSTFPLKPALAEEKEQQRQHHDKGQVHQPIGEKILTVKLIELAKAAHERGVKG